MGILTEQQITDLAFLLSIEYHDHVEDQAVAFDSYEDTITQWSKTFGEHPPATEGTDNEEVNCGICGTAMLRGDAYLDLKSLYLCETCQSKGGE